ncbi:MAG: EAL domain-containing protein [Synechococcaceae cyanobacterium]|nr:EAL domain-containing protein [Synechococcaceae cyanobacterium]
MREQRRLEQEVRRLRHELGEALTALPRLRQMVEGSGDLLLLIDPELRLQEANSRLTHLLGLTLETLRGRSLAELLPLAEQYAQLEQQLKTLAPAEALRLEVIMSADGSPGRLPMELEGRRIESHSHDRGGWILSLREISEERQLAASAATMARQRALSDQLESSQNQYRQLVDQLSDGLALLDGSQRFLLANPALHAICGLAPGQLLGQSLAAVVCSEDHAALAAVSAALASGPRHLCRMRLQQPGGARRLVELQFTPRRDGNDSSGSSMLARDITELDQARQELERLAYTDSLTGLANEQSTLRFLAGWLAEHPERALALLWLDLDGFRRINHTHGREAGDALLRRVAAVLQSAAGPGDWLARFGGDEFLIVRPDLDAEAALAMAARLQQSVAAATRMPGAGMTGPGFCAGLSLHPADGRSPEELLRHAATALSLAHDSGTGLVMAYESRFTSRLLEEQSLELRLRAALARDELFLVFQPQVDGDGRLIGSEALLRWRDGEHGLVSPSLFIPLAERTGLIHELGIWVLDQACLQQRRWLEQGLQPPPLAVNVSPAQFPSQSPGMDAIVAEALQRHRLPAELLELEITESSILPIASVGEQLEKLEALGVTLAIDDFGTGFSSLESLHRLPIHKLKIDQTFVANLEHSASARLIVQTALTMGRGLGLRTLVEGVETERQVALLASVGCQAYQGYYFARPMDQDAFTALLRSGGIVRPQAP